jgi:MFS family permease
MYLFVFMTLFTFAMAMQGTLTLLFVGQYLATPETASSVAGLLFSALGIGGVLGAFLINRLVRRFSMLALLFSALVFDGAIVIVFSLSNTFLIAWICFALLGIIGSVIQIVQDTIIQTVVPEHMRGRVYGAFGPITGPISLLSIAGGASLASVIGTRMVFLVAGLLEIATVLICRLLPSYSRVRDALLRKFAL